MTEQQPDPTEMRNQADALRELEGMGVGIGQWPVLQGLLRSAADEIERSRAECVGLRAQLGEARRLNGIEKTDLAEALARERADRRFDGDEATRRLVALRAQLEEVRNDRADGWDAYYATEAENVRLRAQLDEIRTVTRNNDLEPGDLYWQIRDILDPLPPAVLADTPKEEQQ